MVLMFLSGFIFFSAVHEGTTGEMVRDYLTLVALFAFGYGFYRAGGGKPLFLQYWKNGLNDIKRWAEYSEHSRR